MNYRISDVSKITGIPIDTIRYYIKSGIIHPVKKGSYYSFGVWDINYLLDYRKYHNLGFSMKSIISVFENDDLATLTNKFKENQNEYIFKEEYYHNLAHKNEQSIMELSNINIILGKFKEVILPDIYCLPHRQNHKFKETLQDEYNELYKKLYGLVDGVVTFDTENFLSDNPVDKYEWLLGIDQEYLEPFLSEKEGLIHIKSRKCLYTVIKVHEEGTFSINSLSQIKNHIVQHKIRIYDLIIGKLLAKVHEDGVFTRYISFYIPIE